MADQLVDVTPSIMTQIYLIAVVLISISGCSTTYKGESVPDVGAFASEKASASSYTFESTVLRLALRIDSGHSRSRLQTIFNQLYDNVLVESVRALPSGRGEYPHLEVLLKQPTKVAVVSQYLRSNNVWIQDVAVDPDQPVLVVIGSGN